MSLEYPNLERTQLRIAEALEDISNKKGSILSQLDGTKKTYDRVMRRWFLDKGAEGATPAKLTELVDKWYTITKDEWDGWVDFYPASVSSVSTGTKGGDNSDLTLVMSTDSTAGQDDYAGLPFFACVDCNWQLDENGEPQITAINGITTNFERSNVNKFVGVLQQSGYYYHYENATIQRLGYTVLPHPHNGMEKQAEAVKLDGSYRSWIIHGKYVSGLNGSKLTACSGQKTAGFTSHNTATTRARAIGAKYSGGCACDIRFMQEMFQLMTASKTADGILQGCVSNNTQKVVAAAESDTNRLLLTAANAANFEIGMTVMIGTNAVTDRGTASTYSISGQYGREITDIKSVTVSGTTYTALYVDGAPFTTTKTTQVTTLYWKTGTTDNVLGNNGSYKDNTSGKYPAKIQGIEYAVGGYDGLTDSIIHCFTGDDGLYYLEPYTTNTASKQATSLTDDYIASGLKVKHNGGEWTSEYIKEVGYARGIAFATNVVGGSSSTYYKDALYHNGTSGDFAWFCFGHLDRGVAYAGLFFASVSFALSVGDWTFLARLSPNGNRGEA